MSNPDDYKELAREVNELSKDLAKGLSGLSYMIQSVADANRELRRRVESHEKSDREIETDMVERITKVETTLALLKNVSERIGKLEHQAQTLDEHKKDVTGRVQTIEMEKRLGSTEIEKTKLVVEDKKSERDYRKVIAAAAIPGAVALGIKIMEMLAKVFGVDLPH